MTPWGAPRPTPSQACRRAALLTAYKPSAAHGGVIEADIDDRDTARPPLASSHAMAARVVRAAPTTLVSITARHRAASAFTSRRSASRPSRASVKAATAVTHDGCARRRRARPRWHGSRRRCSRSSPRAGRPSLPGRRLPRAPPRCLAQPARGADDQSPQPLQRSRVSSRPHALDRPRDTKEYGDRSIVSDDEGMTWVTTGS